MLNIFINRQPEASTLGSVQWMLDNGGGHGCYRSEATVFQGEPGYFFLGTVNIEGATKLAIQFHTVGRNYVLTANCQERKMAVSPKATKATKKVIKSASKRLRDS